DASAAAFDTPPRFILSPYRSGTTLLRYCLDSHPDLAVPPETEFLRPLGSLLFDSIYTRGYRDLGYEVDAARALIAGMGREPLDVYAAGKGAIRGWIDKTPSYAERPE